VINSPYRLKPWLERALVAATILLGWTADTFAQTRTLSGRVVASGSGEGLAGILVGIAQVSAIRAGPTPMTAANGTFTLQVPAGPATLAVRGLGYKSLKVAVAASQATLHIELELDPLRLDEMVVSGQATDVSRRHLANAIASIKADQLNITSTASIESMLAGKIAGADIQSNSGAPGGGNQVNLRGVGSFIGSKTPIYVVDGVIVSDAAVQSGRNAITAASPGNNVLNSAQDNSPNRIADLNPADVESIEILKGASAAAIYGSQANNGVILIRTKRGNVGPPRFNFKQMLGVAYLANKLGTRLFHDSATAVAAFGEAAAPYFANGNIPRTFDLEDELAGRPAPARESALTMTGGTEASRYFISGLAHNETGVVLGTYYDKYSVRINLDHRLNERVFLDVSTNAVTSTSDRGFTNNDNNGSTYYSAWAATPSFADLSRHQNGTFPDNPFFKSNPLQTAASAQNVENVFRFLGSVRGQWTAVMKQDHSLQFSATAGSDVFLGKDLIHTSEDLQFERLDPAPGTIVNTTALSRRFNLGINAVHRFAPSGRPYSATTSVGVAREFRDLDVTRNVTRTLVRGQQSIGLGATTTGNQTRNRGKDLGLFAQEEVLLANRLLFIAGVRTDRSSSNADVNKWFAYPKLAASYRATLPLDVIDELKFRIAWGRSGNQPLPGDKNQVLFAAPVGGLETLQAFSTTVARDLRPERQTELEGGLDAAILNHRVSVELTGYRRVINDLLLNRPLAPSSGFVSARFNSTGQLRTTGLEAALVILPVQRKNISWTSRVVYSTDRSMIDSLDVPAFGLATSSVNAAFGNVRLQQGRSASQIVGRDIILREDDPRCLEALNKQPGSGSCPAETSIETAIGDANPDFRVGFSNQIRYHRLTLDATLEWQHGGDGVNYTGYLLDVAKNSKDFDHQCIDAGCLPGEGRGDFRNRVYPALTSRTWLEDRSYVKVREVAVNIDISPRILQSTRALSAFRSVQLGFSARNLITWTNYTGFDPEGNNFGTQAIRANFEAAPYPPSRSLWLSMGLTF
jgi:TonB-dependent starch-binding outer membrane protein SusC